MNYYQFNKYSKEKAGEYHKQNKEAIKGNS